MSTLPRDQRPASGTLKFVGHVGNLLPPLEEQRLSFFWEIDVGKLGHESSQVTHIGSVGGLMLSSKFKKFVKGYRVQIEANGLKAGWLELYIIP